MKMQSTDRFAGARDDPERLRRFLAGESVPVTDDAPGRSLAMVYAPKQEFARLFAPEIALQSGTLFSDLNKPFRMTKCAKGGCLGD